MTQPETTLENYGKRPWVPAGEGPTKAELSVGVLQRIATAIERQNELLGKLVKDRQELEASAAFHEGRAGYWKAQAARHERSARALRGAVTKLKRKLAAEGGADD